MKIYNSLTQRKEEFTPLSKSEVKLYVCGVTPYDTTHLGHAFTYMTFDVLIRYLNYQKYNVNYTQNVTDIDDDILRKAKEVGKEWKELGQFWTDRFVDNLKKMHMLMPTHYVKATESIPTIIEIVNNLQNKGFAYEKDGTVYFRVSKDPEYGKLSHYKTDQMIALSRQRGADPDDPNKENPLDFIMWQRSLPDEPSWDSPWGKGRPGWHIECSAMNYTYLGPQIDIHGGGIDLLYPHHESEIAQTENFTGNKPFCNYWMHTGAVMYEGEKMSKSLGNLIMVSDLLETYSANAIRYLLLAHHYRSPWEYCEPELKEAAEKVKLFEKATSMSFPRESSGNAVAKQFEAALDDDLNTPKALEILDNFAKEINAGKSKDTETLRTLLAALGFIV